MKPEIKEDYMSEGEFNKLCTERFTELFDKARRTNEIQFLTSFFAFHKLKGYNLFSYITDFEFREVLELLSIFNGLQGIEEIDAKIKTRMMMLVYCHIIEVDFIYLVLFNMIRTIRGESYSPIITQPRKKKPKELIFPSEKVELLRKKSAKIDLPLNDIYSQFYFKELRNAFSHSQYYLDSNGRIVDIYNKSNTYIMSFLNVYGKFMSGYMNGDSYGTNFGKILFHQKHGWKFEDQLE